MFDDSIPSTSRPSEKPTKMQAKNTLQKALKKGTPTFGFWQMLPGTSHTQLLLSQQPDWICVDTEHGNISDSAMHEAVATIASSNVSPVVRIAANEAWMVKRALDTGAHGIVVPLLNTADDARALVSAAKFPPQGKRGFGSPFAPARFGVSGAEYLQQSNDALVTIVQIETREALQNVSEIAAVPGVDVLLVGPFDLGNSIGYPILGEMHQELKTAVQKIHDEATKAGKRSGIYCTSGEQAREYADKGFTFISAMTDVVVLQQGFEAALGKAKGGWGHAAVQGVKGGVERIAATYSGSK